MIIDCFIWEYGSYRRMFTTSNEIYPEAYFQLKAILAAIVSDELEKAQHLLVKTEQGLVKIQSLPQKLQLELFINAMRARLEHVEAENLYLVLDEGQQIRLFNFMVEKFPIVYLSQEIAKNIFFAQLAGETGAVILDIGIGNGQQMARLIQQALRHYPQLKQLNILGIEPSLGSLQQAEARFATLAEQTGASISLTAIHKTVEQLDSADWVLLEEAIGKSGGKFLVNASFALHHVDPIAFRTEFFKRLKALKPSVVVLIEPYADYTSEDLLIRFENAWHHYGVTFRAIDTIDADEKEKSAVKRLFFGREMIDVLGERNRGEQYETAETWVQRLVDAGFAISPVKSDLVENFNSVISIDQSKPYFGFNVSGHPIVAVICAN